MSVSQQRAAIEDKRIAKEDLAALSPAIGMTLEDDARAGGVMIASVARGGAADEAGVVPGGVIVGVPPSREPASLNVLKRALGRRRPGQYLVLTIRERSGRETQTRVMLGAKDRTMSEVHDLVRRASQIVDDEMAALTIQKQYRGYRTRRDGARGGGGSGGGGGSTAAARSGSPSRRGGEHEYSNAVGRDPPRGLPTHTASRGILPGSGRRGAEPYSTGRDSVQRFGVADDREVSFGVPVPGYRPTAVDEQGVAPPVLGARDVKVDSRDSWVNGGFVTCRADGRPVNPAGRTGVCGRGVLPDWGPNQRVLAVATRWAGPDARRRQPARGAGSLLRRWVEVRMVRDRASGRWRLPETAWRGSSEPNAEAVIEAMRRDNAAGSISQNDLFEIATLDGPSGSVDPDGVWRGYLDDSRNTDNSWVEGLAMHSHLSLQSSAAGQRFRALPNERQAAWIAVTSDSDAAEVCAGHLEVAAEAARRDLGYASRLSASQVDAYSRDAAATQIQSVYRGRRARNSDARAPVRGQGRNASPGGGQRHGSSSSGADSVRLGESNHSSSVIGDPKKSPARSGTPGRGGKKGDAQHVADGDRASGYIEFVLRGRGLPKPGMFGKLNPYVILSAERPDGSVVEIARTEVQKKTVDPSWAPLRVTLDVLCGGDIRQPIRFECCDSDKWSQDAVFGVYSTNVASLTSRWKESTMVLAPPPGAAGKVKTSGHLFFDDFKFEGSTDEYDRRQRAGGARGGGSRASPERQVYRPRVDDRAPSSGRPGSAAPRRPGTAGARGRGGGGGGKFGDLSPVNDEDAF